MPTLFRVSKMLKEMEEILMKVATEKIINEVCKELGFQMIKAVNDGNVISFVRDDYNLLYRLEHISLQISLKVNEKNVTALIFPDPIMVNGQNKERIIKFINHINWFVSAFGHFYVDTNNDIAYAIKIPNYIILNYINEAKAQLFRTPIAFYTDIQIPLMKLSACEWDSEIAIKYIDELYSNGFVSNDDYGV